MWKRTLLIVLAVLLPVAFVVAPPLVAGGRFTGERELAGAFGSAFTGYWRSGGGTFTPELRELIDYWMRYHLVKAVTAGILLVVLTVLGVRLWGAFARAGRLGPARRAALAAGGTFVTVFALFSLGLVMANVQGMIAPFASLLPLLTDGSPGGPEAAALEQVRQGLAAGSASPALTVLIEDFARYHVAMAVIAAVVAAGLAAGGVLLWRRFAATPRPDRRTRRVLASSGVLASLLPLLVAVIAVANTTTAADPAPALLALLQGGW
ncbi:hypothetical protein AB0G04_28460 [Actinoplanes sp. NPDC023801]|uniref:hypothetical protein n=1 Tax=Actinoplanes sp. NPDC023801 TaxID=3154595 RepID=UPI0033CA4408